MIFHGFQKLTLLDFPGKTACTLFTGGCNFRCPFCHNASLVLEQSSAERFTEDEIFAYLKKRVGLLDGVCVTGGEPLLQKELPAFLEKVHDLGFLVKLDTNGSYPDRLANLIDRGLVDYVAMDIKNSKEKYAATIGVSSFDLSPVEQSVSLLLSGKIPFEFRTTVAEGLHTVDDIRKIAEWIKGVPHYYIQNFVDSGNLIGSGLSALPKNTLSEMRDAAAAVLSDVSVRGV